MGRAACFTGRVTARYTPAVTRDPLDMDSPVARTKRRGPREVTLHIRVTVEMAESIDKLAEEEERNRSDMLRILISRGWKRS